MASTRRDDIDRFFDYGLDVSSSTLYIGDTDEGVDALMAERVIKGLQILDRKDGVEINIILNTEGGDVTHGMAIYDTIKACKNHVNIIVRGAAMSMGSVILQAADTRIVSPNSRIMIHYGTTSIASHTKNFMNWAKEEKRSMFELEDIYLAKIREKHPKFTREMLQNRLNFDTILSAKEALELGLVDSIEGEK